MLFYQRTFIGFTLINVKCTNVVRIYRAKMSEYQPECELFLCNIKYGKSFWKIFRIEKAELIVVAIFQNQEGSNNEKHLNGRQG